MIENIEQEIVEAKQCLGCTHQGLIVTSVDGIILETSPAAERILEAPSLSLKGKQVREFYPIPDTYEELVRQTDIATRSLNRSVIVLAV